MRATEDAVEASSDNNGDNEGAQPTAIVVKAVTREPEELANRVGRLRPKGPPLQLEPRTAIVQFLRGVNSRASMMLPAFYLHLASHLEDEAPCSVAAYPGLVLTHWLRYSSINTITLSCRKAFDHAAKGLTGAMFGKTSDAVLENVAEYWAEKAGQPKSDALAALLLLRSVFRTCSQASGMLFDHGPSLGKRIGLLKQHADRTAAHLSLESYEFSQVDCAHVVGSMVLIGEIIRTFDGPAYTTGYFNAVDEAGAAAARALFPAYPEMRLFAGMDVSNQARWCWKYGQEKGEQMLFEQLPYAMGWW